MLTRLYIEALLVDEEAADVIWEAWDAGEISTYWAVWGWWLVTANVRFTPGSGHWASIGLKGRL